MFSVKLLPLFLLMISFSTHANEKYTLYEIIRWICCCEYNAKAHSTEELAHLKEPQDTKPLTCSSPVSSISSTEESSDGTDESYETGDDDRQSGSGSEEETVDIEAKLVHKQPLSPDTKRILMEWNLVDDI
jgi:hypothetical protein